MPAFFVMILCLLSLPAHAAGFAGAWTSGSAGRGFNLILFEQQNLLCGFAEASDAHKGDGAFLVGRIEGAVASIEVGSVHNSGYAPARGPARLQERDGKLWWDANVGYYPAQAVLEVDREHKTSNWDADVKTWCDGAWMQISEGEFAAIDLEAM